jgi:beta-ureidopropionase / N-carbamoyl-L-amino-acid hydrolase
MTMVAINSARLVSSIEIMGAIGALPGGGSCRVALTDADRDGRDLFVGWCKDAGCSIDIDCFGNIFARLEGRDPTLPAITFGSHLDTQPTGGRFDGIYGVLAGLEVLRSLNDAKVTPQHPLVLINWTNEEGVRFNPGLTGAEGFAGERDVATTLASKSTDGSSFGAELTRTGYAGLHGPRFLDVAAYIEAHIEQGPILEQANVPIGVVTGVQGVRWYEVSVQGANRHAGTTPMPARQDSFMAVAETAVVLRAHCRALAADLRFTIGRVAVAPGSVNTSPGQTKFTIDLRHPDEQLLDRAEIEIAALITEIASRDGCTAETKKTFHLKPVTFDATLVSIVQQASDVAGYGSKRIVSGAMHDACPMAKIVPTTMIFIPCRDGVSHDVTEYASETDMAAGTNVLMRTILAYDAIQQ